MNFEPTQELRLNSMSKKLIDLCEHFNYKKKNPQIALKLMGFEYSLNTRLHMLTHLLAVFCLFLATPTTVSGLWLNWYGLSHLSKTQTKFPLSGLHSAVHTHYILESDDLPQHGNHSEAGHSSFQTSDLSDKIKRRIINFFINLFSRYIYFSVVAVSNISWTLIAW